MVFRDARLRATQQVTSDPPPNLDRASGSGTAKARDKDKEMGEAQVAVAEAEEC